MKKDNSNCWELLTSKVEDNQQRRLTKGENVQRLKVLYLIMKIMYIVYKTTNLINGKIYVGVHRTNVEFFDFYFGCGCYKKDLKKHKTSGFPGAIKKYGWKNFKRETLFEFPDTEEGKIAAYKKEEEIVTDEFIKRPDTYNLTRGGQWTVYETLKKPVAQYTLDGKFIRTWESASDAQLKLGLTSIYNALLGVSRYCGEWQWRYYNGDDSDIEATTTKEKSVYQFDLQGNLVKCWKSITEAAKSIPERNTDSLKTLISKCCLNQNVNQVCGYFWSFKPKFEFRTSKHYAAVAKYNDAGEFLESYTTLKEAAEAHGLKTSGNIITCIKGKQKHCGGFRWRYFYGNKENIPPLEK